MARGYECSVHSHDQLIPQEVHHIWPRGYGGPDIPSNKTTICCNAHSDTHYLLEAILRQHPVNYREYGQGIRLLARAGASAVLAHGEAWAAEIEAGKAQD